jgi:hypothetical protein
VGRGGWKTMLLVVLPLSLAAGFMVAGVGTAIWPPVSLWAAPLACSGTVESQSDHYSTSSGGSGVSRHFYCLSGDGKEATSDEITFVAIGIAGLLYAAIAFLLLQFLAVPRLRRAAEERAPVADFGGGISASGIGSPTELQAILGQVAQALQSGQADLNVRTINIDASGVATEGDASDPASRLAALKQLRDSGLISDGDYESKKAEILAGL